MALALVVAAPPQNTLLRRWLLVRLVAIARACSLALLLLRGSYPFVLCSGGSNKLPVASFGSNLARNGSGLGVWRRDVDSLGRAVVPFCCVGACDGARRVTAGFC